MASGWNQTELFFIEFVDYLYRNIRVNLINVGIGNSVPIRVSADKEFHSQTSQR